MKDSTNSMTVKDAVNMYAVMNGNGRCRCHSDLPLLRDKEITYRKSRVLAIMNARQSSILAVNRHKIHKRSMH
jgi:hypothetical protein